MQVKIRVNVMLGIACCALLIIACGGQSVQNNMNKPNVILVMTDDQGYGDLSVHGNPVLKTPNLDQLYQETVHLTDFHVAPMCTPTRGQLLSGRDAMDNGATFVCQGRSMPREELPFMADIFGANGYRTGHFGKWHLGTMTTEVKDSNRGRPGATQHFSPPWEHGFDACFSTEAMRPVSSDPWRTRNFLYSATIEPHVAPSSLVIRTTGPWYLRFGSSTLFSCRLQ